MAEPQKKYYRIGEVSRLTGVEPHVLRYWESEFRQIRPRRVAKQRLYRHEDVELIKRIKTMLYDEGFTIAGAKKRLSSHRSGSSTLSPEALLQEIKSELMAIMDELSNG